MFATNDHVLYIHMSQLAKVAPVGQDTTTKLLRPLVVAGHQRHILPQGSAARLQLDNTGRNNQLKKLESYTKSLGNCSEISEIHDSV